MIRILGKILLALFFLIFFLWILLFAALQTEKGQELVLEKSLTLLENLTQTKIQVKKGEFSFPCHLNLQGLSFSQNEQLLLKIEHLDLSLAYSQLLQGKLVFSKLRASEIDIFQFPHLKETPLRDTSPFILPFYLKFEEVDIQKLNIKENLSRSLKIPKEIDEILRNCSLAIQGVLSNNPFKKSLNAHLLMTAKSDQADLSAFSLGIDTQNKQLSLSFHVSRIPFQTMDKDFPSDLRGHLALFASAPLSTWQDLLLNSASKDDPLEGHFRVTLEKVYTPSFLSTLVGKQTTIRAHYHLSSIQEIAFSEIKIENPSFLIEGSLILNPLSMLHTGKFEGKAHHLQRFKNLLKQDIENEITFQGETSGHLKSPLVLLDLKSSSLTLNGKSLTNPFLHLQMSPTKDAAQGFAELFFIYEESPWKGKTSFDWRDEKIKFSQLQMELPGSYFKGELTASLPQFIWKGDILGKIDNIQKISQAFKSPLRGKGAIKAHLTSTDDFQQKCQIEFKGSNLEGKDWQAEEVELFLLIDPLKGKEKLFELSIDLESSNVKWKEFLAKECAAHTKKIFSYSLSEMDHFLIEWRGKDIFWPNGEAQGAQGKLFLEHPLEKIKAKIEFALHNVKTSSIQLQEIAGATMWDELQPSWPFKIRGNGNWKENLGILIEGHWHYQEDQLKGEIASLSGKFGPYPLELKQPFQFDHQPKRGRLEGLFLQLGEGELQANFKQEGEEASCHFQTNALPLELFHFIDPNLPLIGRASFKGHLKGRSEELQGNIDITLLGVQITEDLFAQKPIMSGKVLLHLAEKGIQIESHLNGIGQTPFLISGNLPYQLSLNPFQLQKSSHLPFNLQLIAEGEIEPYLHLFSPQGANISGRTKIALELSGQISAPQIKGTIDLTNGTFESISTGALYHHIQAHLQGDGSKIILSGLSAQDNKNGLITARGAIHLDTKNHFPFEFDIEPKRVFILDSDYVDISASGLLKLIGNTKKSKLQGELNVDRADLRLEEALPHQIKNIDIQYINAEKGRNTKSVAEKKEESSPIELAIKLHAQQNVYIRGENLKSQWKGSVDVFGTPDHPLLYGDLHISEGEYVLKGRAFNLNQGTIHFAGPPNKKTTLYVVAAQDIERITAEIIVKGPVNQPVISFRSYPPLSQREILSYILFNRGISDITSDQGDLLTQSFMSLQSNEKTKSHTDFLSRLRNNIGIDRLDFTVNHSDENHDVAVQASKNITENITVTVNQSMTSLSPIISIEAKLRKNLKVQAAAGVSEDAPVRMSLKWKKDY